MRSAMCAAGSHEITRPPGSIGMTSWTPLAENMIAWWESWTPLGWPVVPDV